MRSRLVAAVLLLLCVSACTTSAPTQNGAAALARAADAYWQHRLDTEPGLQIKFGLPIRRLPDVSHAGALRNSAFAENLLRQVDSIDRNSLTSDQQLSWSILRWDLQQEIARASDFWLHSPVTPYATPINGVNEIFTAVRLDPQERARLLGDYARFIDQLTDVVREQRQRGFMLPKAELPAVRRMMGAFNQPAETSMFRGGDASAPTRDAIEGKVRPALQRMLDLLGADYEQHAPDTVGMMQYPGGAAAYRRLIRQATTLDLSPEEVHALGLREVERIGHELESVRQQAGFTGTLPEFRHFLTTDPRFFGKSPEDIAARLTEAIHSIEPSIPRFFSRVPRAAYDVKRLDPALEGSMTFGYYHAPNATDPVGHYFFNGSRPSERNLLFARPLMLHELIPGHHFQFARQSEDQSLPAFRRENLDTAFVEGWGEYAASLGKEMGLYDEPYAHAGRLVMESLLSTRLVVDTGMNALGWSRERAMQYMRENTFLSETEIATESLRYSVDLPAQALAYKIGSLKMLELRDRARKELGDRFDIRQFHEWVIGQGSMPLSVLEQRVNEQIRAH